MRRGRIEMYADILEAIWTGHHKRRWIMCVANLTWARLALHLEHLERQGLVRRVIQKRNVDIFLTKKGREAVECYRHLREVFGLP